MLEVDLESYVNNPFNNNDKLVFEAIIAPNVSFSSLDIVWKIEYYDNNAGKIVNLLESDTYDDDFITQYHGYFVINANDSILQPDINYNVIVNVKIDRENYPCDRGGESSNYIYDQLLCDANVTATDNTIITMNSAPTNGSCTISTSTNEIYALETLVNVTCQGWVDEHEPLKYRFIVNDGMCIYRVPCRFGESKQKQLTLKKDSFRLVLM